MKMICKLAIQLLFIILIQSCSASSPHDNFKNHMQMHIGGKVTDPASYLSRYSERIEGRYLLTNGNTEVGFIQNENCKVFFEVDSKTNIIIDWRFDGEKIDCVIVP